MTMYNNWFHTSCTQSQHSFSVRQPKLTAVRTYQNKHGWSNNNTGEDWIFWIFHSKDAVYCRQWLKYMIGCQTKTVPCIIQNQTTHLWLVQEKELQLNKTFTGTNQRVSQCGQNESIPNPSNSIVSNDFKQWVGVRGKEFRPTQTASWSGGF